MFTRRKKIFEIFTEFQFESDIMNLGISNNFDGLLPTKKQDKNSDGTSQ